MPQSPPPGPLVSLRELSERLVKVLISETPVRLVKAGKLDGVFTSSGGENKRLIEACINSSPALLERVGSSGTPDPKSKNVRLTTAGLEAIADHLPMTEFEQMASKAAGVYRQRFQAACVKATRGRLTQLAAKQRQLIAEGRRLLDHATEEITQQINALDGERSHTEAIARKLSGTIANARPPRPEPADAREYDFLRNAAELLIFAWQDAVSPDVRTALEGVFGGLGIRPMHRVGDIVAFDGRHHDTLDSVDIGDQVLVQEPGWALKTHRSTVLLTKSVVSRPAATTAPPEHRVDNAAPSQE